MDKLIINDKVRLLKLFQKASTIEGRIKLQKIVYLMQQLSRVKQSNGFDYGFIFYNYGTFSQELAKDVTNIYRSTGYIIEKEPQGDGSAWEYSFNGKNGIEEKLKDYTIEKCFGVNEEIFTKELDFLNKQDQFYLELLSTLVFLVNEQDFRFSDDSGLKKKIKELKPHLRMVDDEKKYHDVKEKASLYVICSN